MDQLELDALNKYEKPSHAEAHVALQSLTIILEWYVRTQGEEGGKSPNS